MIARRRPGLTGPSRLVILAALIIPLAAAAAMAAAPRAPGPSEWTAR